MSHWPSNDGKLTSHGNFKLRFFKNSFDLVKGFHFEFDVVEKFRCHW